jgi:DNA-binding CsgD family transcriptional regulator
MGGDDAGDRYGVLLDLTKLLGTRELGAEEVLQAGAERVARALGDTCIASRLSDDRCWLQPLGLADPDPAAAEVLESLRGVRAPADSGFPRHILESRTSLRLPETSPEVVLVGRPQLASYARQFGIRSAMLAPMRARGDALGHMAAIRHRDGGPFTAADERFLQSVADILGLTLRAGGDEPDEPAVSRRLPPPLDLSDREREILALLALGHINREIAERLHLSVRTVEWHRARMQWKLGVSGRAALATLAREHGIVA